MDAVIFRTINHSLVWEGNKCHYDKQSYDIILKWSPGIVDSINRCNLGIGIYASQYFEGILGRAPAWKGEAREESPSVLKNIKASDDGKILSAEYSFEKKLQMTRKDMLWLDVELMSIKRGLMSNIPRTKFPPLCYTLPLENIKNIIPGLDTL